MVNGCVVNGGGPVNGAALHLVPETPVPRWARYHVKVYNTAGEFLAYIDKYDRDSEWEDTANEAETLTLVVSPRQVAGIELYLTRPNELRLYDMNWRWVRSFLIFNTRYKRQGGDRTLEVVGKGMLALFEKQTIASYVADTPVKISEHLAAWFAGTGISIGYIDPSIANKKVTIGTLKDTPLSQAVDRLREAAGGYYAVDRLRNFNWYTAQTGAARQILHLSSSVVSYDETVDKFQLANMVTVIGGIDDATKNVVTATATDAASIATYGPAPTTYTNRAIKTQALAQDIADKKLAESKTGRAERRIGAIDLSQVPNTFGALAARPSALFPGLPIKVVPPVDAILTDIFETNVLRVRRKLGNPADAEIEVGTVRGKDWIDLIVEKEKQREEDDREDTNEDEKIYDDIDDLQDQITELENAATAFTDLTDAPHSYEDQAWKVPYVLPTEDGLGFATVGSFLTYANFDSLQADGVPVIRPIWAEVQSDGQKTGLWYFPSTGESVDDWVQVWPWFLETDNLTGLGNGVDYNIQQAKVVFIPAGMDNAGVWYKPAGATGSADCVPMNAMRDFDE